MASLRFMRNPILARVVSQQQQSHLQTVAKRTMVNWIMYSAKKGVNRDLLTWIQQPIDLSPESIHRWVSKKEWQALKADQKSVPGDFERLGPDLAAAHFIVNRGGAVRFLNTNQWVEKDNDGKFSLPNTIIPKLKLEAVDASNTSFMYETFGNFDGVQHLQYLNVSGCKHFDDWCVDHLQMFKDTLMCLDVSRCPRVTERGLASLHKINLQCLRAYDMPSVENIGLTGIMLEEMMPNCKIEGMNVDEDERMALPDTDGPNLHTSHR